jgi:hypothetical protein
MTDTAQPLPDEIEPEDPSALTPEQQQRAAALTEARFILASNGGIFGGQKLGERFTVQDLLTVGDYILGVGPFVSLEQIGAAPIDSPDNRAEGTEVSPGLEYVTTFKSSALDDPEPKEDVADDDTAALPAYPEDALPR